MEFSWFECQIGSGGRCVTVTVQREGRWPGAMHLVGLELKGRRLEVLGGKNGVC